MTLSNEPLELGYSCGGGSRNCASCVRNFDVRFDKFKVEKYLPHLNNLFQSNVLILYVCIFCMVYLKRYLC
jgi:hypothetical protein